MAQAQVLNTAGAAVSTVELNESIFGVERNDTLIHQAVLPPVACRLSPVSTPSSVLRAAWVKMR